MFVLLRSLSCTLTHTHTHSHTKLFRFRTQPLAQTDTGTLTTRTNTPSPELTPQTRTAPASGRSFFFFLQLALSSVCGRWCAAISFNLHTSFLPQFRFRRVPTFASARRYHSTTEASLLPATAYACRWCHYTTHTAPPQTQKVAADGRTNINNLSLSAEPSSDGSSTSTGRR